MKKTIAFILLICLFLTLLSSCSFSGLDAEEHFDDVAKLTGVSRADHENYTVFTFDKFDGKATLKMERVGLGEGQIYYRANLTEGSVHVMYDEGIWDSSVDLITLAAGVTMPDDSAGGYVERDEIAIIFKTYFPISGEILISFVPIE